MRNFLHLSLDSRKSIDEVLQFRSALEFLGNFNTKILLKEGRKGDRKVGGNEGRQAGRVERSAAGRKG